MEKIDQKTWEEREVELRQPASVDHASSTTAWRDLEAISIHFAGNTTEQCIRPHVHWIKYRLPNCKIIFVIKGWEYRASLFLHDQKLLKCLLNLAPLRREYHERLNPHVHTFASCVTLGISASTSLVKSFSAFGSSSTTSSIFVSAMNQPKCNRFPALNLLQLFKSINSSATYSWALFISYINRFLNIEVVTLHVLPFTSQDGHDTFVANFLIKKHRAKTC